MKKSNLVVVSVALFVIGFAVLFTTAAAQGDGSGEIVLCISRSGKVRRVANRGDCISRGRNSEQEIYWNEKHPVLVLNGSNVVDLTRLPGSDKFIAFDTGDGWKYLGADDLIQLLIGGQPVLQVADGVVDMTEGSGGWTYKFGEGAEFAYEPGDHGGFVFTNEQHLFGDNKIMFRNEVGDIPWNEFHFFENRAMYISPRHEFIDQDTGEFSPDVAIDDNLLDLSGMMDLSSMQWRDGVQTHVGETPGGGETIMQWEWDAPEFDNNKFAIRSKHPPGTGGYTQNEFHFRHDGMEVFSNGYSFLVGSDETPGEYSTALSLEQGLVDASASTIKGKIFITEPACDDPDIADGGFVFWDTGTVVKIVLRIGMQCFETDMTSMGG